MFLQNLMFIITFQLLYCAGIILFARFYAKEENSPRARMVAVIGAVAAVAVSLAFGAILGGIIGVLAGFYVADHKNRGRGWALLPLLLGPLGLLLLVLLPKLPSTSTLALNV